MDIQNIAQIDSGSDAYSQLKRLFDEGSFAELGKFVCGDSPASIICGYGAVNGALTFAFAQDFSRESGAFGKNESDKVCSLYDMAEKCGAPVVGIFSSAGVRVLQGEVAMAAFGKFIARVNSLSGIVPQIAVVDGVCGGMMSVALSMFDVIITSDKASVYTTPSSVLKAKGNSGAGTPEKSLADGVADIICSDPVVKARDIVTALPQNNSQGLSYLDPGDSIDRITSDFDIVSDIRDVIKELADNGTFEELKNKCAPEIITGLASLGNITTGIIATERGAFISGKGVRKAAEFLSFCDNFMIPVLTLVDTAGFEEGIASVELARLGASYASSSNAKVTAYIGKAYGSAYTLFGSKSIGADVVFATKKAEISVMAPDTAVEFVYGDEINSPEIRAEKKKEWISSHAVPEAMASLGEIDDIVEPQQIRLRTISALLMLSEKADGKVLKKHSKLPF